MRGIKGSQPACAVCGEPSKARGYCSRHYTRYLRGRAVDAPFRRANGEGCRKLTKEGYVRIARQADGVVTQVYEHRAVMEGVLGRPLLADETVHHRNGNRSDNRPENLELWCGAQPRGQRPEDLVAWAREIIARYG